MPTLLTISGSLRSGATNRKLLAEATRLFGECTVVEADLNLSLYDGDDEDANGIPAAVQTLFDQISAADAVLISTPEYNGAPPGVLKNALDWVSRVKGNPWADKPVALMGAAAGRSGTHQAQSFLRIFMLPFRARIVPGPVVMLAGSHNEFDDNGHLKGEMYVKTLQELMDNLRAEMGV